MVKILDIQHRESPLIETLRVVSQMHLAAREVRTRLQPEVLTVGFHPRVADL